MKKRACLRAADNAVRDGVSASRRSNHEEPRDQPYVRTRGCRTRTICPASSTSFKSKIAKRYFLMGKIGAVKKILEAPLFDKRYENAWIPVYEICAKGE